MLHRYDWSESSLILEVFTRHHGRLALAAKGAKRPTSSFRPVLLPLQPLQLSFGGDADIRTLKSADWLGGHVMPTGDALLSGYYVNELLMRLLVREDAHPLLFDVYDQVVRVIASRHVELLQIALRAFELLLLRETGFLPTLDAVTLGGGPLRPEQNYSLLPEAGLREAEAAERALSGAQWTRLQRALDKPAPFTATLRACAPVAAPLKPLLRRLLHYHCGVSVLRTRQMMLDLQDL